MEGPPHGLALFRVLFGCYWFIMWGSWHVRVERFFSSNGFSFPRFETPNDGNESVQAFFAWLGQPLPLPGAWLIYSLMGVAILFFTFGFLTRIALLIFLATFTYYWALYLHMLNSSFHRLLYVILLILLFSPCDRVWSISRWLEQRKAPKEDSSRVPLWTQRLICVQIMFMYLGTGIFKILSPAWNDGENVASSLMGDWATPMGFWILQRDFSWGVYDLTTLAVILFEIYAVTYLFHPRYQKWIFAIGFLFHLGNALTLHVWQFMIMPLAYILFVAPEKVAARLARSQINEAR